MMVHRMMRLMMLCLGVLWLSACQSGGSAPKTQVSQTKTTAPAPQETSPLSVGLFLPLSGSQTALGESLHQAALLAGQFAPSVILQVYDTGESEEDTKAAVAQALRRRHDLWLGPIFSRVIPWMLPEGEAPNGVPVLSFSNQPLPDYPGVVAMGFQPFESIERVVSYGLHRGITDYYVLLPADRFGKMVAQYLQKMVPAKGGVVLKVEYYQDSEESRNRAAQHMFHAIQDAQTGDAEAMAVGLILPDLGSASKHLLQALDLGRLPPWTVRVMSGGVYESKDPADPAMEGVWFAGPPLERIQRFKSLYQETYHQEASRLASLAFDAVGLAELMAKRRGGDPPVPLTLDQLKAGSGFDGVNGIFRVTPERTVQRLLSLYEIQNGKPEERDPSPGHFGDDRPLQ
jgi:outer membrane PBP1 activator LpoA protein